jgi:hypothetical protein
MARLKFNQTSYLRQYRNGRARQHSCKFHKSAEILTRKIHSLNSIVYILHQGHPLTERSYNTYPQQTFRLRLQEPPASQWQQIDSLAVQAFPGSPPPHGTLHRVSRSTRKRTYHTQIEHRKSQIPEGHDGLTKITAAHFVEHPDGAKRLYPKVVS